MHALNQTEVLIVGAGPAGLLSALILAENDVDLTIIDQEERTAAHSYACALHPSSLEILDRLHLTVDVLALGRRIDTVGLYDWASRRAEIQLGSLGSKFPYLLVLPQSDLEALLERRLSEKHGINVRWNHRLSDLKMQQGDSIASIEKLSQNAKGYIVPELDWEIERTLTTRAAFIIGADGSNSFVREKLGIERRSYASPRSFFVYEFESDQDFSDEVRIVLADTSTHVFWPLAHGRCRWTIELPAADPVSNMPSDRPSKDRTDVVIVNEASDNQQRAYVRRLIANRASWFKGAIKELEWSTEFESRLWVVNEFGRGRCWLCGDAAHQTSPIGVQSMNVGLREAEDLSLRITKVLRGNASLDCLEAYGKDRTLEWRQLFDAGLAIQHRADLNPWVRARSARILSSTPASGDDLVSLVNQVGLDFDLNRKALSCCAS